MLSKAKFFNVDVSGEKCTIEVHHGGFFIGFLLLRSYVDEKVSWFDHCEVGIWSTLRFDDIVEQLGYTKLVNLKVYWSLPRKTLEDGLRIICTDADTNAMCSVVDRVQNLVLYADHEGILANVHWDDLVVNPIFELPKVISPVKVTHVAKEHGERIPEFYKEVEKVLHNVSETGEGSKEYSADPKLVDSG